MFLSLFPPLSPPFLLCLFVFLSSPSLPFSQLLPPAARRPPLRYSNTSHCSALVETWCCRASCKQRLGRAGRVRNGVCFQLFSDNVWGGTMEPYQLPEIQRRPLEELVLQV